MVSVTYMMTDLSVKKINANLCEVTVQEMSPLRFAPVDMTGTPKIRGGSGFRRRSRRNPLPNITQTTRRHVDQRSRRRLRGDI